MHSPAKGSGTWCRECTLPPRVPTCAAGVFVQWKWNNLTRVQDARATRGGAHSLSLCVSAARRRCERRGKRLRCVNVCHRGTWPDRAKHSAHRTPTPNMSPIANTTLGPVAGALLNNGVREWLGIQYATTERWAPPVDKTERYASVLSATSFGPSCPQFAGQVYNSSYADEQCLYINCWSPPASAPPAPTLLLGAHNTVCG
jgi:hypothetical protein